jgi:diguanylate cyclase (GGDEF)-like protein
MNGASRLSRLILGASPPQRLRLQQTLLACIASLLYLALHWLEAWAGITTAAQVAFLSAYSLICMAVFYALIRSGLNLRFGHDPALTLPQQVFAMVAVVWSYAIAGADRGAALAFVLLVLVFGLFAFRPRDMVRLSLLTLTMLAAVILWQCHQKPAPYSWRVGIFQLSYTALAVWPIWFLSARISALRARLTRQKNALAQALEQIRRQAEIDDLTGLINRRAMAPILLSEMQLRNPAKGQNCLALIDIDLFKTVNDRFGHQAGDEVLRTFAKISKATLRTGDIFARWGGEEFLLLLPDTSIDHGVICLERMRAAIAETSFEQFCPGHRITISVGVTDLHPEDRLEEAVERADQAMYKAKQQGRNQVVTGRLYARAAFL